MFVAKIGAELINSNLTAISTRRALVTHLPLKLSLIEPKRSSKAYGAHLKLLELEFNLLLMEKIIWLLEVVLQ